MKIIKRTKVPSLAYPGEERELTQVDFDDRSPHDKMRQLRLMIVQGANPILGELAAKICSDAGVAGKDHLGEAVALLKWTQDNVRYVDDGTQTFRDPEYTISQGYGNCANVVIVLGSLCEAITIPVKIAVLEKRVAFLLKDAFHVYLLIGLPPRDPQVWLPAEATMPGWPLGQDPAAYAEQNADKL